MQRRAEPGQEHPQRGKEGTVLAGGGLGVGSRFSRTYARRGPDVITIEQIGLLLAKFSEMIVQKLPERYCSQVLKNMDVVVRAVGIVLKWEAAE